MKKIINCKWRAVFLHFSVLVFLPGNLISSDSTYLGQEPPGTEPEIFAPGIISLEDRFETYPTFSPDGTELFFTVTNASWSAGKILHTKEQDGTWPEPDTPAFSNNDYINWESFISPDGQRMFFASNRPTSLNTDIWMIEKISDTSWSEPVRLDEPVNSSAADGSACVTDNGTLYFKSRRGGGTGGSWLFRSVPDGGIYSSVESLGGIINTGYQESEPYMSRDESYLIFISETRSGGQGGWDLWICFQNEDSFWTDPLNMGSPINTSDDEYGPRVTHDGKYFFFTREERGQNMDIYWIDAAVIEELHQSISTSVENNNSISNKHNIIQNYPNPFNHLITFRYSLPGPGTVTLSIYNITGQKIETLVNGFQTAGEYEVTWQRKGLPGGMYLYKLHVGEYYVTRKLILKE